MLPQFVLYLFKIRYPIIFNKYTYLHYSQSIFVCHSDIINLKKFPDHYFNFTEFNTKSLHFYLVINSTAVKKITCFIGIT